MIARISLQQSFVLFVSTVLASVADLDPNPDPSDPDVFESPGSGIRIQETQKHQDSGSFYP